MRMDFNKFAENQVFLMKDGTYIIITDVSPNGRVEYKQGVKYTKKNLFANNSEHKIVFEDAIDNISIMIDCSKSKNGTTEELYKNVAMLVGTINKDALSRYNKVVADYVRSQGW